MDKKKLFEAETTKFIKSLTPISVLALMGDIKNKLHYEEACVYLQDKGHAIEDFYFNRGNYLSWFCYYRDFVLLDITHFTAQNLKDSRIIDFISLENERLNAAVEAKNFKTFFYMIDKRIALYSYQQLFDCIPDNEKYELLWLIYSRCNYHLQDLNRESILEILKYKPEHIRLPAAEADGYLKIFRGQIAASTPVNLATSWTTDINTAIFFAARYQQVGNIYSARIKKDRIAAYIKRLNTKEIVAFPEDIEDIKNETFVSFEDLLPELEEAGVIETFRYFSDKIKPEYFHNPYGIHGIPHTKRVLLLVLILAHLENISPEACELLGLSALYHDIGRMNDNFDPHHGRESFKKLSRLDLLAEIENRNNQEIIHFIISNHCVNDRKALKEIDKYHIDNKRDALKLFNIFKDADGLDRIRINDLDISQLRNDSAKKLPLLARQLLNSYL